MAKNIAIGTNTETPKAKISTQKKAGVSSTEAAKSVSKPKTAEETLAPAVEKVVPAPTPEAKAATKKASTAKVIAPKKEKITPKKAAIAETATPKSEKPATKKIAKAAAPKKESLPKKDASVGVKVLLQLKYKTTYGQTIQVAGDFFGNGEEVIQLQYFNEESWYTEIHFSAGISSPVAYKYEVKNADGTLTVEAGEHHVIPVIATQQLYIVDSWNYEGFYENTFYTVPFQNVLLPKHAITATAAKNATHRFQVKAPLLAAYEQLVLLGADTALGEWEAEKAIVMGKTSESPYWSVDLNLTDTHFPVAYKYAVKNSSTGEISQYEQGNNRILWDGLSANKFTILNDGFAYLPNNSFKGSGVVIPVFSLRTQHSFGVGEFTDMHALVDWAASIGMKLIQLLPVNDTTANKTYTDSYPYSAISAFALHPLYINLSQVANAGNKTVVDAYEAQREQLNQSETVDYPAVIAAKWEVLHKLYELQGKALFATADFKDFYATNQHWLAPYAAFCFARDTYKTADFSTWPEHSEYDEKWVSSLLNEKGAHYHQVAIHLFVQYHLHIQLKAATNYAHSKGIIVKGDLPIGIYRNGVDAWMAPALYHMHLQAGAPPDDFAVKGQNWGFPTYNWAKMQEDGFAWWKQRFEQMSHYFDAFRIDHILGFFRIWSIPLHAVEGIMGYFVPAIPLHINELYERNISFNHHRYTQPFITDQVLWELAGNDADYVKNNFLQYDGFGGFTLKQNFATQKQVEAYFAGQESTDFNSRIQQIVFDLISNVLLFEVEGSQGTQFHCRFNLAQTLSFKYLDEHSKQQLQELYVNYFFRRQDDFWKQQAFEKLPALKKATNMLICGEDLGLVPACVPDVMQQLGILSLEIQRMPKDPTRRFFHPNDAPYLSVVTPSTHDMSTIRGWWQEDRNATQTFFNNELGMWGQAPLFCEDWVAKAIVLQHLHSPAMWSLFQLQDILAIDGTIRQSNPNDERINVPANPKHYWRFRMHITLEQLQAQTNFNTTLQQYIAQCGRA